MSDTMVATVQFGVGIDTARYGHHVTFLGENRQPAARGFTFLESREGYEQLRKALARLAQRHDGNVQFRIHIDAAGQYAVNLETFLRQLPFSTIISVGEPKRNRDYKNAHFPKRKADPVDSLSCARFAIVERPPATPATPAEFRPLRDLAGVLQSQRRQTTRRVNVLHNHLSRVFPELAMMAADFSSEWVLQLLDKYPTPLRIVAARTSSLVQIPHLDQERAEAIQTAARNSTGSLQGHFAEQLVRHLVVEVRQSKRAEESLLDLLEQACDALPAGGHRQLLTIPGIGRRTAAALVAKIVSIDRFPTAEALVSYFGLFPEENTSGVDKWGRPVARGTMHMSNKGADLVRGLLWMACQSAIQCNPPIRALYARQRAAGKRGDVALGHCMRKMLHLVFAVWKTNKPFDPKRYKEPTPPKPQTGTAVDAKVAQPVAVTQEAPHTAVAQPVAPTEQATQKAAAGRKGPSPDRKAVTAAGTHLVTRNIPQDGSTDKPPRPPGCQSPAPAATDSGPSTPERGPWIDFAELRRQVSMTTVLQHLGLYLRLRGRGPQRRGPCPVHEAVPNGGRTFSVNLLKQVFHCLDPKCNAQGNVLDLWAAVHHLPLRDAALHLAATFHLDPNPNGGHHSQGGQS
ncbi:MAG: transposase [Planctomycetales bacterium]